jgi:pimeloyl-ACP methyl ester carboxylesterase
MRTRAWVCVIVVVVSALAAAQVEEGRVRSSDGTKLFYQKVGNGPQTIIVPGGLFTFDGLRGLGEGRTVIFYDMRNRGRSDKVQDAGRITIPADVEDMEAVRRHFGVKEFTPVGYSYLGLMVVMYAIKYPEHVERIVQIGAVPRKFGTEYPADQVASDDPRDPAALAEIRKLRAEKNYHVTHPKEYCEKEWQVNRVRLVGTPEGLKRLGPGVCSMENEWPVNLARHLEAHFLGSVQKLDVPVSDVKKVKQPVLTIHGTKDRNAPYGAGVEWAKTLPNARLLTVEGAAHQVWADEPGIVAWIDEFLKGKWPDGAKAVR